MRIKEVLVRGKELQVRYESEVWKAYRKQEDIPFGMKGIKPVPKTVVEFMRNHPERVR